jgi:hypothetical protein
MRPRRPNLIEADTSAKTMLEENYAHARLGAMSEMCHNRKWPGSTRSKRQDSRSSEATPGRAMAICLDMVSGPVQVAALFVKR